MSVTTEIMIGRFKAVHGDRYDYSRVSFTTGHVKVTIGCGIHGDFEQSPYNHAAGVGCPSCARKLRGLKKRSSNDDFLKRLISIYGDKYDFSQMNFVKYAQKVKVICSVHGEFEILPVNLLKGRGCVHCGAERRGRYNKDYDVSPQSRVAARRIEEHAKDFIDRCRKAHGDKYDYSHTVYAGMRKKITVVCPKHGEFDQVAFKHLGVGQGCPSCATRVSKPETEIVDYLKSLGVAVITQNRTLIKPAELDIFLPEFNTAIEYNGLHWHADDRNHKYNLFEKYRLCDAVGVRLIHIFEDEWLTIPDVVKGLLRSATRQRGSIGARECRVEKIEAKAARGFLNGHHLQGFLQAKLHVGIKHRDVIVAVASFGKPRFGKEDCELIRYASSENVLGGLSRTISFAKEILGIKSMVSFCDMRTGTGKSYEAAGFADEGMTPPDYWWFKKQVRIARYRTQKHRLKTESEFAQFYKDELTEREICAAAGYRKIYGVGHRRFVWHAI